MTVQPEMLNVRDVAPILGVKEGRVYQLIASGAVPSIRRGRSILVPRRAFEAWLNRLNEQALAGVSQDHTPTAA